MVNTESTVLSTPSAVRCLVASRRRIIAWLLAINYELTALLVYDLGLLVTLRSGASYSEAALADLQ
jgi:hypothetical protein